MLIQGSGLIIPLIGTTLGSAFVFFMRYNINSKIDKLMNGYAIGVMLSSSVFSLLIPSIEMSKNVFVPITGFTLGFVLLMLLNYYNSKIDKISFSVTLHNIPEGMAVGVCFAGVLLHKFKLIQALILSICIAVQNIPEGSIISIPMFLKGKSKKKSFIYGFLSGIVEFIAIIITIIFVKNIEALLPYFLSFASSAMIYVVIDDLSPEIKKGNESLYGLFGVLIGFIFMMFLDVTLG